MRIAGGRVYQSKKNRSLSDVSGQKGAKRKAAKKVCFAAWFCALKMGNALALQGKH